VKLYRFHHPQGVKAGCCNSGVTYTYWMAESREEAEEKIADHTPDEREDHGNCSFCLAELLVKGDYEIVETGGGE